MARHRDEAGPGSTETHDGFSGEVEGTEPYPFLGLGSPPPTRVVYAARCPESKGADMLGAEIDRGRDRTPTRTAVFLE